MQRRRRFGFASQCRPSQCATDSFVGWREDGDYTSIGCWGWGSKGRIRVRAAVCVTIAATRGFALDLGLLDLVHGLTCMLLLSARLQFDEQLVSIKRRVAVKYLPGALPCGSSQMLGILHPSTYPRLAALQVEGGNVGPNVGSAATPPSRLFTPFGRRRAAALRRGFQ